MLYKLSKSTLNESISADRMGNNNTKIKKIKIANECKTNEIRNHTYTANR